jgi:transcriptional regulator with XRE-family HTH domain
MSNGNEIFGMRLKTLRLASGLSQKQLGIQSGIDEFVASTRINRYEQAVHRADYSIAQRLADTLNVSQELGKNKE